MSFQLTELRAQLEKVMYETKEAGINSDVMRDENIELTNELNEFKVCPTRVCHKAACLSNVNIPQQSVNELKLSAKSTMDSQKEKLRAEKMSQMMAAFDPVRSYSRLNFRLITISLT